MPDMASYLGLAGGLTIAAAMRGACTIAEKSARPEALREVSDILKDVPWSSASNPSSIVQQIFEWTFGTRHLSRKCIKASALATIAISVALTLILHRSLSDTFQLALRLVQTSLPTLGSWVAATLVLLSIPIFATLGFLIPDYVALAKTRYVLHIASGAVSSLSFST